MVLIGVRKTSLNSLGFHWTYSSTHTASLTHDKFIIFKDLLSAITRRRICVESIFFNS